MPSHPSPTHPWTRLLRLATAWLAAALLMQALQGAMALGAGPRHVHHRPAAVGAAPAGHVHAHLERHHHRVDDASVQRSSSAEDGLDAASLALSLAMALMAFGQVAQHLGRCRSVLRAAVAWFWASVSLPLLRRPPRAC
jgi:hypothetical protein